MDRFPWHDMIPTPSFLIECHGIGVEHRGAGRFRVVYRPHRVDNMIPPLTIWAAGLMTSR